MPLVLPAERWRPWLVDADPAGLLTGTPAGFAAALELRPVSAAVGDVRNDGPGLIAAVPAPALLAGRASPVDGGSPAVDLTLF